MSAQKEINLANKIMSSSHPLGPTPRELSHKPWVGETACGTEFIGGNWIKGVNDYWKHLNFSISVSDFRHGCYTAV